MNGKSEAVIICQLRNALTPWSKGHIFKEYNSCAAKQEIPAFCGIVWDIFYVSLTVRLIVSITLANDQLDAQIFNTFFTILYMYMFR